MNKEWNVENEENSYAVRTCGWSPPCDRPEVGPALLPV